MRASTVFLILGTLGAGVAIGDKLNPFGGNRGIATAPAEERAASSPSAPVAAPAVALAASAAGSSFSEEEEARRKKALSQIDELAAGDLEKNLASALGGDSLGQQVARALIAGRHQELPGASEIHQNFLAQLRADPKSGFDVVREAMHRIPEKGFEADRMTLIQTAASLSGMESDARELALQELTSNVVEPPQPSQDGAPMDPSAMNAAVLQASLASTAHRIFIELTLDADQAYAGTMQGLLSQPDAALRRTMIDKFIGKFPDRREALQQELAARQIDPYSVGGPQVAMQNNGVVVQAQTEAPAEAPTEAPVAGDPLVAPAMLETQPAAETPPVVDDSVANANGQVIPAN